MIEEFANYIYLIIGISGFILGFWQFRKWYESRANIQLKKYREGIKQDVKLKVNNDLDQYINNPEETIAALKADRIIKEKEHDTKGIETIDLQIKAMQVLAQIPKPARKTVARLGGTLLAKAEKAIQGFEI